MADGSTEQAAAAPGDEAHAAPPHAAGPILAAPRESAATASRPDQALDERYHIYEANPAPWWVGVGWLAFLIFGATYLIVNLLR